MENMDKPATNFLTSEQIIKQLEARMELLSTKMRLEPDDYVRGQFDECDYWLNLFKEVYNGEFTPPQGFEVKSVD